MPKNIPFSKDRSYCPNCNKQLYWYELIPVVSYIIQLGKCRGCKQNISVLYPLMEFFTGVLFAFSYIKIGLEVELILALLLISMLIIIFVTDITYMLIPNKVLLFFLPFIILMRVIVPLDPWYNAILGVVTGYVLIAIIILVSRGGMGAGDMKLFGVLGIIFGFAKVLLLFFLAALLGAVIGSAIMLVNRTNRKIPIPFGPYIVIAAIITYFYGDYFISWYLSLI